MGEHEAGSVEESRESLEQRHPTVVGIGASAGGLHALKKFLAAVPENSGLAYVVVTHLPSDRESHLAELLQPHSPIPVIQVTDNAALEPNHVYVIPPDRNLSTVDSHLRLTPLEKNRGTRAPVDHFFRTMAESLDGHAVAVVLTGTGSDGALGIRRVRERGGFVIVQDPAEAEFDGMPRSAIESGAVDIVLPLADMPRRILELDGTRPRVRVFGETVRPAPGDSDLVPRILTQIQIRTGHDFTRYKRSTIERRVERRMQLNRVEKLSDYLELLRTSPQEAAALAEDLLINVTAFFRDHPVFDELEQHVIPSLFEGKGPGNRVRVWSVGCATGEEAYSIGMLLLEEASRREHPPQIQIFASDLHERSLRHAREGIYPETIAADISPERLARFFHQENGGYRVRKELRERVVFAPHNLLRDPPFSHLDLVACRNVLIYLQPDVQTEVQELFHYALHGEGYLLLGTAEMVSRSDLFRMESKEHHLYRRRNIARADVRLPNLPLVPTPVARAAPTSIVRPVELVAGYGALHQLMVERYAPPSLVVDAEYNVLHLSEHAGRYLQVPGGPPSTNVFKLVREELRTELRAALLLARERQTTFRSKPIPVHVDGELHTVVLRVSPTGTQQTEGLALVIFDEIGEAAPAGEDTIVTPGPDPAAVRELEAELEMTRGRLQALVEEFESSQEEMRASNEELQSANEELRSTMEEIETGREELQSVNEELQTLNQENRHKVEELSQLSGDLQNLLKVTDIATLFLDRALRINRFTPRVGELFNIRLSDRGRPLTDLTHRLGYSGLLEDARRVLQSLIPAEREVETQDGGWYLIRVLPYRTVEDRIEGVVMTFVNISALKRTEAALRASEERQKYLVQLTDALRLLADPAAVKAAGSRVLGERLRANRVVFLEPDGDHWFAEGRYEQGIAPLPREGPYSLEAYGRRVAKALAAGEVVSYSDIQRDEAFTAAEREERTALGIVAGAAAPVVKEGRLVAVLGVHAARERQWTEEELKLVEETAERTCAAVERARAAAALRTSEEKFRTLFESMDEGFALCELVRDADGKAVDYRYLDMNPALVRQGGVAPESLRGRRATEAFPGLDRWLIDTYARVVTEQESVIVEHFFADVERWFRINAFPRGGDRFAVLFSDVSARKHAENALRESELRFRAVADLVPDLLWESAPDGSTPWFNARWYEYTGQTREEAAGWGWVDAIHRDDRARAVENYRRGLQRGEPVIQEYRIRGAGGSYRWFLVRVEPHGDGTGRVTRWLGAATDIHVQRLAIQEVEQRVAERTVERDELRRALTAAEEAERRRLARELHDEAGQQLTALGLGLEALSNTLPAGSEPSRRAAHLRSLADSLSRELHALAVRLRPKVLDDFGLEAAITAFTNAWSAQSGVTLDVHAEIAAERLPPEVETAVYRIVQEALANVAKHSEAKRASVVVERRDGSVVAIIEDDGKGFDLAATERQSAGPGVAARPMLGLLGIRERAALLGGTVELERGPGQGTTLFVRIPITPVTGG